MDIPLSIEVNRYYHSNRKISAAWTNPPILISKTLESKNYRFTQEVIVHRH